MIYDKKQIEYRETHKRCKFCKYNHYRTLPSGLDICYWECLCKDTMIRHNLQAIFCKYYEIEKGDLESRDEV